MFASILNILKKSDGYVHFSDICNTLERNLTHPAPNQNQWRETVRECLGLAHSQGLVFKSDDDRYKFAVNLVTAEDPKLLARIDALKRERQQGIPSRPRPLAVDPVEEIAGPSGYAYRIVPREMQENVSGMEKRKDGRSRKESTLLKESGKRPRSRSSKRARNPKK